MPRYRTIRRVHHSAADMFALVADCEAYPQFVPLCTALRVRRRETREDGVELMLAEMEVGYKAIRERFTTRVALDAARSEILVEYVDGPFRHLRNRWRFRDIGELTETKRSEVEFFIDYEFRSRTLGALMGAVFDDAFRKFADAFEARADKVYGR
ncbi:MAG: type II toxin-antitoxin system RatA family toxin, partial [Rhodoblastus sp.]|nr:type II toxin-antitoxin system RatA family toxin [Rhodoblastus sp.]